MTLSYKTSPISTSVPVRENQSPRQTEPIYTNFFGYTILDEQGRPLKFVEGKFTPATDAERVLCEYFYGKNILQKV